MLLFCLYVRPIFYMRNIRYICKHVVSVWFELHVNLNLYNAPGKVPRNIIALYINLLLIR